jgi:hypothetical protein
MAYGEPETGGCECKSDEEGNLNEDDLIKILNAADINENNPSSLNEHESGLEQQQPEPTINGI